MKTNRVVIIIIVFFTLATVLVSTQPANAASPESDFRFKATTGTITSYRGAGGVVEIPETIGGVTVTAIGNNAFYQKKTITSIIIPDCITGIGERAFINCSNLTSVNIPDGITGIGLATFEGCSGLAR